MNRDEFANRFGVRPRKVHDPLRLGKWRRTKIVAISSVVVAGVACNLVTAKLSNYPGHSMLQKYVIDKQRPINLKKPLFILSTVVFLTTGTSGTTATTFPGIVSGNAGNIVECIGGGGSGGPAGSGCCSSVGTGGGGGGGYAKLTGFAIGATFTYAIGGVAGSTTFNGLITATGGTSGTLTTAGVGGSFSGSGVTGHTGGNGGASNPGTNSGGGSGGGAAGLNGNGNAGSGSGGGTTGPAGGSGDAGSGGGGGSANGGAGGVGNEYGSSHGSGGGGGGANGLSGNGGNGGLYGGGGGGCDVPASVPGTGAQGLIVVTYTPLNFISDLSNMVNPRVRTFVVGY